MPRNADGCTGAHTGCVGERLQTDSQGESAAHECTQSSLSQPNRSVVIALGVKQLGPQFWLISADVCLTAHPGGGMW